MRAAALLHVLYRDELSTFCTSFFTLHSNTIDIHAYTHPDSSISRHTDLENMVKSEDPSTWLVSMIYQY